MKNKNRMHYALILSDYNAQTGEATVTIGNDDYGIVKGAYTPENMDYASCIFCSEIAESYAYIHLLEIKKNKCRTRLGKTRVQTEIDAVQAAIDKHIANKKEIVNIINKMD